MSKEHANHNAELCDLLLNNGRFNDWVVTTAFYAALHFVHYILFPLKFQDKTFYNFNKYYWSLDSKKSKHSVTRDLVKLKFNDISPQYDWLFFSCLNARYKNFRVEITEAREAKKNLDAIKERANK